MKGSIHVVRPDDVEVEVRFAMTLEKWEAVAEAIKQTSTYDFQALLRGLIREMSKTIHTED